MVPRPRPFSFLSLLVFFSLFFFAFLLCCAYLSWKTMFLATLHLAWRAGTRDTRSLTMRRRTPLCRGTYAHVVNSLADTNSLHTPDSHYAVNLMRFRFRWQRRSVVFVAVRMLGRRDGVWCAFGGLWVCDDDVGTVSWGVKMDLGSK